METKYLGYVIMALLCLPGCAESSTRSVTENATDPSAYEGTASITKGLAKTTVEDIYVCERGRKTDVGEITSLDGKTWTVPAATNFQNDDFPFAEDLHNPCNGNTYSDAQSASAALEDSDIVEVDQDGEFFTAYVFGDNYFEMYVNGKAVGKDPVPFTQFNSCIVRFRAKRPLSVAMKLVDWEEHLGVGCEANRGNPFHAGDGGMVAVLKDENDNIVAKTDGSWKAQTFYTAPISDLHCVTEKNNVRYSENCNDSGGTEGASLFGLHWPVPENWMMADFDDSAWPNATTYTNKAIGVDNKPSYTNFTDIFDDESNDAKFIWSSNVVLDNEVLVRFTLK